MILYQLSFLSGLPLPPLDREFTIFRFKLAPVTDTPFPFRRNERSACSQEGINHTVSNIREPGKHVNWKV